MGCVHCTGHLNTRIHAQCSTYKYVWHLSSCHCFFFLILLSPIPYQIPCPLPFHFNVLCLQTELSRHTSYSGICLIYFMIIQFSAEKGGADNSPLPKKGGSPRSHCPPSSSINDSGATVRYSEGGGVGRSGDEKLFISRLRGAKIFFVKEYGT